MENKKENSLINIFIYFLIIILVILIILPPITRLLFKEEIVDNNNYNTNSNQVQTATALICKKEVTVGTMVYNVNITSNYSNDTLNKVTFNYQLPTVVDNTITTDPVMTEINTLRATGLVEESNTDETIIFILTKENKLNNPTITSLDNYFKPLQEQKTNLESLGYTCQSITA